MMRPSSSALSRLSNAAHPGGWSRTRPPAQLALSMIAVASLGTACRAPEPEGLARSRAAATTVKMDVFHKPLPEIPLPNDLATRFDATSATDRRVNASMLAPTALERRVRRLADQLDGWGLFQPITIPFTGPLDVGSILAAHRDPIYGLDDDVIYLINVDRRSKQLGRVHHLDLGNGNYPVVLEDLEYWENDPRGHLLSLAFEEVDEDLDGDGVLDLGEDLDGDGTLDPGEDQDADGVLDPPEDTDADGVLDVPNYLPGAAPAPDDLAARADALMTFYERETNTLIARPMVPLEERTTYAVVVTRRLTDASGEPVGSPYEWINHTSQTEALRALPDLLPPGLAIEDVAFAFSFTTQSVAADWIALRDGLYGHGVQASLGRDYPAEVASLEPARDPGVFAGMKNPYIVYTENLVDVLEDVAVDAVGIDRGTAEFQILLESQRYIDYYVVGTYESPQLFERTAPDGTPLPLDEQSWPPDLWRVPAKTRSETVYFWLAVPRKEVSSRGAGQPPPVVIAGHGYTSSRFEMLFYAGYFARQGLASIAIDCPSHGLDIHPVMQAVIEGQFRDEGLEPFIRAAFKSRAFDQNSDFKPDSGADYWTSYVFHTRDIVRQSALDYMQLIRMIRGFDGETRWKLDVDGDGQNELAGDFDADGEIDIGGDATIGMIGGSLGGIMSMVVGSLDPEVGVVVPIAGGGGMSDIGIRSRQGGVREAVGLRIMSPVYTGTLDATTESLELATIVPDLNDDARIVLAHVPGVRPWDSVVVENLVNGKVGCGYVSEAGRVRVSVESDLFDATRFSFYRGPQLVGLGDDRCEVRSGREPYHVQSTFEERVVFQGAAYEPGAALIALGEGMGLRRGTPALRRFMGIAQLVLDPTDPAVISRHMAREPLVYPGTGQQTGGHALVITTVGDMNVPASSGLSVGRAAGLIPFLEPDPRYGKPANQVLIDTYMAEAVNKLERYTNPEGRGVHIDVENFSQGTDRWGTDVPRLDPPLRLGLGSVDAKGGISGAIFPYAVPEGQHGFAFPGEMTDDVRQDCRRACTEQGPDPCGCGALRPFDVGFFMFNMLGRYFSTSGAELSADLCNSRDDCAWKVAPPAERDRTALP